MSKSFGNPGGVRTRYAFGDNFSINFNRDSGSSQPQKPSDSVRYSGRRRGVRQDG
jgi:hypothetical protein